MFEVLTEAEALVLVDMLSDGYEFSREADRELGSLLPGVTHLHLMRNLYRMRNQLAGVRQENTALRYQIKRETGLLAE